jgi:hypothetical protein
VVAAALAGLLTGCGSESSGPSSVPAPVAAPTATPAPTPTPRQTAVIDAAPDFIEYSPILARLSAPQAFEFTVRPLQINVPYPSRFAHTVDVWLSLGNDLSAGSSVGFAAMWLGNDHWIVASYTPSGGWYYGRSRFDLAMGQSATFRITKHNANIAEFFVNGVSMESVNAGADTTGWVRARVVGTAAEISWVPALSSTAVGGAGAGPFPCLFCAPRP